MEYRDSRSANRISGNLTRELRTEAGSIAERSILISKKWLQAGLAYVRLAPEGYPPATHTVREILKSGLDKVLLLQAPDDWWDPEDQDPPQTLVKLLDERTVTTLSTKDFDEQVRSLKEEWGKQLGWTATQIREDYAAKLRSTFSAIFEIGSVGYKAENLDEVGLTRKVCLNLEPIPPGSSMQITRRWRIGDYFFISLQRPEDTQADDFTLKWAVNCETNAYVILSYPPNMTDENEVPPQMVAMVVNKDNLRTLSDEELQEIAIPCVEQMESGPRSKPSEIVQILNDFPEWQKVKSTAAS